MFNADIALASTLLTECQIKISVVQMSPLSPDSWKVVGSIPWHWGLSMGIFHVLCMCLGGFPNFLLLSKEDMSCDIFLCGSTAPECRMSNDETNVNSFDTSTIDLFHMKDYEMTLYYSAIKKHIQEVIKCKTVLFCLIFSETTCLTKLSGQTVWSQKMWCPGISLCSLCCWSPVYFRWPCALCRW